MTTVKSGAEPHLAQLLGELLERMRLSLVASDDEGLRPSQHRVMAAVPPKGLSVTDLAERVGMTKQGCGQFVSQLASSGHLEVSADPRDGRVRLVRRTPTGDATARRLTRRLARLEREWAAEVGDERYAAFRQVLVDLALTEP